MEKKLEIDLLNVGSILEGLRVLFERGLPAPLDLRGADLRGARLRGVRLNLADLGGADLRGANLYGANLEEVRITPKQLQQMIIVDG